MKNKTLIQRGWGALKCFGGRRSTSPVRMLPDFVIIGAQKGGTSFLHALLREHPCVKVACRKEIHFFDLHFGRGLLWYRSHFPLILQQRIIRQMRGHPFITGEATPYYLYHPHALRRMANVLPQVKLIVILRNPVDRAYSNYQHEKKRGFEPLTFEEAVAEEETRLRGEVKKMHDDEYYNSFNHLHYSYLHRGIYVEQLETVLRFFPRSQLFVAESEQLYADPHDVFTQLLDFLMLPSWLPSDVRPVHVGGYRERMTMKTREQLQDYFAPHNLRLSRFLQENFGWEQREQPSWLRQS